MILITGGMGFIGLHTARAFLDAGEDVVITRFRTWREPSFIKDEYGKRVKIEGLDATSPYDCIDLVKKHNVDSIVHLAVPGLGALSAAEDFRVNTLGLINMLEAGRICGVRRVSIASSTAVYSGVKEGPMKEDMPLPLAATNPTEAFKKTDEVLGGHYADRTGLDVKFLRISGIWGPLYHSMSNLPSRMVHRALKNGTVEFAGDRGGTPFELDGQDMCYVKDCAAGIVAVHNAKDLKSRSYNVSHGAETNPAQVRDAVLKAVPGAVINLEAGKSRGFKPNNYLDLERTTSETGYKPKFTVDAAIQDYTDWLKAGNQY